MKWLMLAWGLVTWVLYNLITVLVLQTVGYFLVPIAIWQRRPTLDLFGRTTITNAPRWLWLWGNDEDGYEPAWYTAATPGWNKLLRMWVWAAWRNPVNNLRFVTALHPPPVPSKLRVARIGTWTLIWQNWAVRLISPTYKFTIGWKYDPSDFSGISANDWRQFGVGFGTRLT